MENIGTIITVPISNKDIWDNMEVILCSGGTALDVVKISHMTLQGNYYVIGNTLACEVTDDMHFAMLYVKTKESVVHPIMFSQWKKLIKTKLINSDKAVIFELLPSTFVTGYYTKLCMTCGSYFSGHKKQVFCESCSEKDRRAKVDMKEIPKEKKRKRTIKDGTV
jgi:hypothetical protein